MDDIEICKRIAEICGAEYEKYTLQNGYKLTNWNGSTWQNFNPLVDDALCFQLMVEYKVLLRNMNDIDDILTGYQGCIVKGMVWCDDESPNKAICMSIIEANK